MVAGLLAGLIFFTQQDQVLILIPFVVWFWFSTGRSVAMRAPKFAAGFGVILVPLLLYLGIHPSLGYFWQDAFQFNFSWYTTEKKSLFDHFRTIRQTLDAGNYELPFLIAATLGVAVFFLRHRKRGLFLRV